MAETDCCWPGCTNARSEKYPALPLCSPHVGVIAHQHRIAEDETRRIGAAPRPKTDESGLIYYVRVGDLVKIGFTVRELATRMNGYPPDAVVLATHPGRQSDEAGAAPAVRRAPRPPQGVVPPSGGDHGPHRHDPPRRRISGRARRARAGCDYGRVAGNQRQRGVSSLN